MSTASGPPFPGAQRRPKTAEPEPRSVRRDSPAASDARPALDGHRAAPDRPAPRDSIDAVEERVRGASAADAGELLRARDFLADPDRRVQRRAAEELGAMAATSEAARAVIGAALASADGEARWGAAFAAAVAARPSRAAVSVWIDCLGSSDRDRRWAAHELIVRHLGEVDDCAVDELLAAAQSSAPQRRKMTMYCLRDIDWEDLESGEPGRWRGERRGLCVCALDAPQIEVRLAAISAYTRLSVANPAAADLIAGYVSDRDAQMRRAAAAAVGKLGVRTAAAGAALLTAARSSDAGLRRAATWALRTLERAHSGGA